MVITFRPGTRKDAEYIGKHLRLEDEREVQTGSGLSGHQAVPLSYANSDECYSAWLTTPRGTVAENPFLMFGVASDTKSKAGLVWLLGTPEIRRAPLSFLREAHLWVQHFATSYD